MSFRTRLTGFFVLIVVVPMLAVGVLVFRLISDSEQGKADARANGVATAASSAYEYASRAAQLDAQSIARDPAVAAALTSGSRRALKARLATLATQAGLDRVVATGKGRTLADVGDPAGVAPGVANVLGQDGRIRNTIKVSTVSASGYASQLASPTVAVVVRAGGRTLGSTLRAATAGNMPLSGTTRVGGVDYRAVTVDLPGFYSRRINVTVLSSLSATHASVGTSQLVAALFIVGFFVLAFAFSALASRALQGQLSRFLAAARRVGSGDFSSQVPTEGHDEFAELGAEFNNMSSQLKRRLDELSEERGRLRESIRRIGQTFASNLDRQALLELALKTAIDAVHARCGRLSVRATADDPLAETVRIGSLSGIEQAVYDAERNALAHGELGEAQMNGTSMASVPLLPVEPDGRVHGLITVGRDDGSFSDGDREVLRSLASQATLALDNVDLHHQVQRQAVTDELTGLANHGRFQEILDSEVEQVRRYHQQVGLIMLDVDDFKAVNDTYGHQQGDIVLKQVARVVRESSRDADVPARYGGEEMALILPHTDLEGSYAIAERIRTEIEKLRIRRLDRDGILRITASLGVAAMSEGEKQSLIAAADGALYEAKRTGKNRTVRATAGTAHVLSGE